MLTCVIYSTLSFSPTQTYSYKRRQKRKGGTTISYGVVYKDAGNEYVVGNPTFGTYTEKSDEVSIQSMRLTFRDGDNSSSDNDSTIENKSADAVTALWAIYYCLVHIQTL